MRVITGLARGSKLEAPKGMKTRPTADKVKEGIFSAIQFDIPHAAVLDLFAGSGQMGIECLSREARLAVFVDSDRACQEIIKKNLNHVGLGLAKQARVVAMDALQYLYSAKDLFDIVFVDPPYEGGHYLKVLPLISPRMLPGGVVVCESAATLEMPDRIEELNRYREYRYGKTKVTIYHKGDI